MSTQLRRVLKTLDATQSEALDRLFELIRIPSVSTDPAYKTHCQGAAEWCAGQLKAMGFDARVVTDPGPPHGGGPRHAAGAERWPARLFYGHYDVQPPEPLELWKTPPFEPRSPTIRRTARSSWRAARKTTRASS